MEKVRKRVPKHRGLGAEEEIKILKIALKKLRYRIILLEKSKDDFNRNLSKLLLLDKEIEKQKQALEVTRKLVTQLSYLVSPELIFKPL